MDPDAELRQLKARQDKLKQKREERQRRLAEATAEPSSSSSGALTAQRVSPVPAAVVKVDAPSTKPTASTETLSSGNAATSSVTQATADAARVQRDKENEELDRETQAKMAAKRQEMQAERERRQAKIEEETRQAQADLERKLAEKKRRREQRQQELAQVSKVVPKAETKARDTTAAVSRQRSVTASDTPAVSDQNRPRAASEPLNRRGKSVSFAEDLVQENLYTPAVSTDTSFISEAGHLSPEPEEPETTGDSPEPRDGDVTPTNTSPQVWTKTSSVSDDEDKNVKYDSEDDDLDALFAAAASELETKESANAVLEDLLDAGELETVAHVGQPHRADARTSVAEVVTEQTTIHLKHVHRESQPIVAGHDFVVPAWQAEVEDKKAQAKQQKKSKNAELEAAVSHITDPAERKAALRKLKRDALRDNLEKTSSKTQLSQASLATRAQQAPKPKAEPAKPAPIVVNRQVTSERKPAARVDSLGNRRLSNSTEDLFAGMEDLDDEAAAALLEDLEDAATVQPPVEPTPTEAAPAARTPSPIEKPVELKATTTTSKPLSSEPTPAPMPATSTSAKPTVKPTSAPKDAKPAPTPAAKPTKAAPPPVARRPSQVKVLAPSSTASAPLPSTEDLIAQALAKRRSPDQSKPTSSTTPSTTPSTEDVTLPTPSIADLDAITDQARPRLSSEAAMAKRKARAGRNIRPRTNIGHLSKEARERTFTANSKQRLEEAKRQPLQLGGATTSASSSDAITLEGVSQGDSTTDGPSTQRSKTLGGDVAAARKAQQAALASRASRGVKADSGAASMAFLLHQSGGVPAASTLRKTGAVLGNKASPGLKRTHKERGASLYQLKGKRYVVASKAKRCATALHNGDCYVLDAVGKLYVWLGEDANRMEQQAAKALAIDIRDNEYGGRSDMIDIRPSGSQDPQGNEAAMYTLLLDEGQALTEVNIHPSSADEAADDLSCEANFVSTTRLSQLQPDGSAVVIATGRDVIRSLLDTDSAYVLETGDEVYSWTGRKAGPDLKSGAWQRAAELAETSPFEPHKCRQGIEPAIFKAKFAQWDQGIELGKKKPTNGPPLESMAFRARAVTSSGLIPNRPAAFENVRELADPHASSGPATIYPVAELKRRKAAKDLPDDVDWATVERHLSEEEHLEVFGMASTRFQAMPLWKQKNLKGKVGLA
eukprot:m.225222 g.225222  ORF g.225222 m.225222 type:complete len:1176 (+) comp17306_c0_seq1:123-3650(+)